MFFAPVWKPIFQAVLGLYSNKKSRNFVRLYFRGQTLCIDYVNVFNPKFMQIPPIKKSNKRGFFFFFHLLLMIAHSTNTENSGSKNKCKII